jgi:hypothetical protein
MNRRINWLLGGLVVLGLVVLLGLLLTRYERVTTLEHVGLRGEAARNPYLAAQHLLTRLGVPTRSVADLPPTRELPPGPGALLWVTGGRSVLSERRHQGLLEWTAAGNHLLVTLSPREGGPEDPLVSRLGLEPIETGADRDAGPASSGDGLTVAFDPEHALAVNEVPPDLVAAFPRGEGVHLASLPLGRGRVTAVSDPGPFDNGHLGEHDHAETLWAMAALHGVPHQALVVYGDGMPPLWLWLWQRAPLAIVSGVLLLILLLVSTGQRFGPVLEAPPPVRRRVLEHVRAAGRFQWSAGQSERLLAAVREEVWHRLERRHPEVRRLEPAERAQRLAQVTGLPAHRVHQALEGGANGAEPFTRRIQALIALRKRL